MALITLKKITRSFKIDQTEIQALKEVNLKIQSGEMVAILGPSGSGKSTLLHLLGCLDHPSTGEYYLNQDKVYHLKDHELAHLRAHKIGFVFQAYNLVSQLNVYENVALPFFYQTKQKDVHDRVIRAIELVGLSHRQFQNVHRLSGGEMQRVAIARALVIDPYLILADEPTGNLDQANGENIMQLLKGLNQRGKTIIIVTHDEKIASYCSRTICMQDGRIANDTRHLSH